MLDLYLPMMRCAGVLAAAQLGLFAQLARKPATAIRLAAALHVQAHGVERLADLLVSAGYLQRRRGGVYANSAHTKRWFTPSGEVDFTAGLAWTREAWSLLGGLGPAIARGGPSVSLWQRMAKQPKLGVTFAKYMRAFAEFSSPRIAKAVTLPRGAKRLLDIGGSHGLHSIAFCRANPGLEAVVFDQAAALRETRRHVRASGMQSRITTRVGDCTKDDLGRGFDAILYFSVAHNQSASGNARVLAKCSRALNAGGVLVMHDYLRGHMPEPYNAAFDLTLLLEVGHRTYGLADFQSWVRAAGLQRFRQHDLAPAAMGTLMTATKP